MLNEKRQSILLVALIAGIIVMTVKALTIKPRNYDEEIGSLRNSMGALEETITQLKGDVQTELNALNESMSNLSAKIENHRHQTLRGNIVFK